MNNFSVNKIPKNGYCLVAFSGYTYFDKYHIDNGEIVCDKSDLIKNNKIYRAHFFNNEYEYRYLVPEYLDGPIENILSKDEELKLNPLCIHEEDIYLEDDFIVDGKKKIKVINRFSFDSNNCIFLENYRLAGLI